MLNKAKCFNTLYTHEATKFVTVQIDATSHMRQKEAMNSLLLVVVQLIKLSIANLVASWVYSVLNFV